jgi:hypothetical protein
MCGNVMATQRRLLAGYFSKIVYVGTGLRSLTLRPRRQPARSTRSSGSHPRPSDLAPSRARRARRRRRRWWRRRRRQRWRRRWRRRGTRRRRRRRLRRRRRPGRQPPRRRHGRICAGPPLTAPVGGSPGSTLYRDQEAPGCSRSSTRCWHS